MSSCFTAAFDFSRCKHYLFEGAWKSYLLLIDGRHRNSLTDIN
jgi:hypothetical protein